MSLGVVLGGHRACGLAAVRGAASRRADAAADEQRERIELNCHCWEWPARTPVALNPFAHVSEICRRRWAAW
jgi:hypothetical protein